jgi:hypothetical protein
MPVTGYTNIGTLFYWAGAPVAAVKAIPQFPSSTGPGELDTTVLAPTDGWKTNIPDGVKGVSAFDVQLVTAPGGPAAMQAIIDAGTIDTMEIRLPNGRSISAATAWMYDLKLGGAAGASSPGCLEFTVTVHVSGELLPDEVTAGDWWDACIGLSIAGGDFDFVVGDSPLTLDVYAVYEGGFSVLAPVADLDFISETPANCTAGLHTGIITWVSNGGATVLTVCVTADPTLNATCICTTA